MQRYAMLFGTYMGIFWILKFSLFPLGLRIPILSFLFIILTLCVPFIGYYYARLYRNQACNGVIGFGHAWLFTIFMYMFASLLAAVIHYIYFQFIDQGFILNTIEEQLSIIAHSGIPNIDESIKIYREAIEQTRSMTTIDITMQLISTNVFWGIILGIPTALFVTKKKANENE